MPSNDLDALCLQQHCVELTKDLREGEERMKESERVEEWTEVLLLDHIRSRNRYVGLLEHWSQQLQLAGRLLLGQKILVILQGERCNIKVLPLQSLKNRVNVKRSLSQIKRKSISWRLKNYFFLWCDALWQRITVHNKQDGSGNPQNYRIHHKRRSYK